MRSRALIKLLSGETGVPDDSDPWRIVWRNAQEQLHRDFGPAVVLADGTQEWWRNGQRHREDGPAIVWPDGSQHWYRNDKLHREDGPAIVDADGTEERWVEGKYIR